jgi:dihydroorotase
MTGYETQWDAANQLDLLISGGRVLDPASGTDALLGVGVRHGRIVTTGSDLAGLMVPPRNEYPPDLGTWIADAVGCIVAPGFIDLHANVYTGVCALTKPADEAG